MNKSGDPSWKKVRWRTVAMLPLAVLAILAYRLPRLICPAASRLVPLATLVVVGYLFLIAPPAPNGYAALLPVAVLAILLYLFLAEPHRLIVSSALAPLAVLGTMTYLFLAVHHIPIDYATTRITGPLRPDGSVDYLVAINQECSRRATRRNNAALLVARAIGPDRMAGPAIRRRVLRRLGLLALPADGKYFVGFHVFAEEHLHLAAAKIHCATESRLRDHPWSARRHPHYAAWLAANSAPLRLAARIRHRTTFYIPVVRAKPHESIWSSQVATRRNPRPFRRAYQALFQALLCRAMLELKSGALPDCERDLLAVHAAGRLLTNSPSFVAWMAGLALDYRASAGDVALANSAKLSAANCRRYLLRLASLPEIVTLSRQWNTYQRFIALDDLESCDLYGMLPALGKETPQEPPDWLLACSPLGYVNYAVAMRRTNQFYDQMVGACGLPRYRRRITRLWKTGSALEALTTHVSLLPTAEMENMLVEQLILPFPDFMEGLLERWGVHARLTTVALALAAYRADHQCYPAGLAALSPGYLRTVPFDGFISRPFHYQTNGKGFILYSVGPDLRDDLRNGNGTSRILNAKCHDIIIHTHWRLKGPTGGQERPTSAPGKSAGTRWTPTH